MKEREPNTENQQSFEPLFACYRLLLKKALERQKQEKEERQKGEHNQRAEKR